MSTTTKRDLIEQVARSTALSRSVVRTAVQGFLDHVAQEFIKGNRLEFRDFGVFEVRERGPRIVRNPRTQEPVVAGPDRVVKFKASRTVRRAILEATQGKQQLQEPAGKR